MFSSKDPTETITLTFDFSALTTSVSSPYVTINVDSGTPDATPGAIKSGAAQISGAKVLQQITGGQNRTNYDVKCTITAADGVSIYTLAEVLPVLST